MTNKRVSEYAELHKTDWIPVHYDEVMYGRTGYDSFVWSVYRPFVIQIVQDLSKKHARLKYLDFACGTGRIISAIEHLTTEAMGLDISPQMLNLAQTKVSKSTLTCGDVLEDPTVADFDYDVITAFRFFLNTEPEMRQLIMRSLASRLADRNSRLIFNIHGNRWSWMFVQSLYRKIRGWGLANTMTYQEVRRLVEDAGLEIEAWYGFGLWPYRLYRTCFAPLLKGVDRWAAVQQPLRHISHDMLFVCRPRGE